MAGGVWPCHPTCMSEGQLQGWFADPFRAHQQRYFSAGRPTKLVRDGALESYDEPPSTTNEVTDTSAGLDPFGSGYEQPGGHAGYQPGFMRPPHPRRRRIRVVEALFVAVIVAVAAVIALAIHNDSAGTSRLASISDIAFVTRSAQRTLSERTAEFTMAGTIQASGKTVTLSGTGEVDFSTDAAAVTVQFTVEGKQVVEKEVMTRGSLYYTLSVNGTSMGKLTGGRDWVQIPISSSSSASLSGSDPRSALVLLEQSGDTVRVLGTKTIGTFNCTGYSVKPSHQAMMTAVQQEISVLKLPTAMANQERNTLRNFAAPTLTVWLDSSGLIRQMSTSMQIGGLNGAASGESVENFSNYGATVHITSPAAGDVMSYKAFLQSASLVGS